MQFNKRFILLDFISLHELSLIGKLILMDWDLSR